MPDKDRGAVARELVERFFAPGESYLRVSDAHTELPLVAARMSRSTPTFSEGQLVYVYDGFFGMNERGKIVGRYRRKHRWVRGVCAFDVLVDCRPRVIHNPHVIALLRGEMIPKGLLLGRLWPMNGEEDDACDC